MTSEAKVIRRARIQTAGRVILWTVVVIVGVRGVVSIFKGSTDHATAAVQSASVTQTTTASPVSDGAKTEAVLFVQQWLTVNGKEKPQDWVRNLQAYVTPSFAADMQKNLPVTWKVPTPTPKGKNPTPKTVPTPNLSAVQANVWASHWVKPGSEALVTVRTQTNDNTIWYLSVPVVKFGDTWRVSSAPALLPQPQTPSSDSNSNSSVSTTILSPQETQEVQAALDPFFRAWLTGDSNTADRYMVNPEPPPMKCSPLVGKSKTSASPLLAQIHLWSMRL